MLKKIKKLNEGVCITNKENHVHARYTLNLVDLGSFSRLHVLSVNVAHQSGILTV